MVIYDYWSSWLIDQNRFAAAVSQDHTLPPTVASAAAPTSASDFSAPLSIFSPKGDLPKRLLRTSLRLLTSAKAPFSIISRARTTSSWPSEKCNSASWKPLSRWRAARRSEERRVGKE